MEAIKRNWIRWLILIVMFIVPLIPFYLLQDKYEPLKHTYLTNSAHSQVYRGDLNIQQAEDPTTQWQNFNPARDGQVRQTDTYWFRFTLPDEQWSDPHMLWYYLRHGDIYLDGELLYSFNTDIRNKQQIDQNQPQLIPLPESFSGKYIYVRTHFSDQWVHPGIVRIDNALNLVLHEFIQSSYGLMLGFVSLLVALTSIILYIGRRERSYLYFSLFAATVVIACIVQSWSLINIVVSLPKFTYFYYIFLVIGGYSFIRFFTTVFGPGIRNINVWLGKMLLLLLAIITLTAIFTPTIYVYYVQTVIDTAIVPLVFGLISFSSIMTYRKNRTNETFWYMSGFVTFALFTAFSFLHYNPVEKFISQYFVPILPIYKTFTNLLYSSNHYMHSIFILMFCMVMIMQGRIRNIYVKATKTAAELAVMSQSLERKVHERTEELEQTNKHLRSSMQETSHAHAEIAVLEDRNRIAHDMHDHIGNDITAAIIQIEAAKMLLEKDANLTLNKLEETRNTLNQGLSSIRETVRMMKEDYEAHTIIPALQKLILETEARTNVTITYIPEPLPEMSASMKKAIYHALLEGITNAIRHGQAATIQFSLTARDHVLHFSLSNDGIPYEADEYGFGLKAMNERIEQLGGTLQIGADAGEGCILAIELPLE